MPPTADRKVYVYGVLSGSDRAGVSIGGVEDAEVRIIEHAGLAALVSTLESDEVAAAGALRAHWQVLDEASKRATVLPVRFGTVLESDAAVRERLLEANAGRLTERLEELADRVQVNLRGEYDEDRLLREVVRASPAITTLRERVQELSEEASYRDRIRLGELVAAEVARRREQDEALALEWLEPLAVAARPERISSTSAAFNLAFLVENGGIDAFSEVVGRLGERLGQRVSLRLIGPLPPYSFAEL